MADKVTYYRAWRDRWGAGRSCVYVNLLDGQGLATGKEICFRYYEWVELFPAFRLQMGRKLDIKRTRRPNGFKWEGCG